MNLNITSVDSENKKYLTVCSVIVALMPIIRLYKSPFSTIGIGVLLMLVLAPYILLKLKFDISNIKLSIPIIMYTIFSLFKSDMNLTVIITSLVLVLYVMASNNKLFNFHLIRRVIEIVSIISAIVVILQTAFFYIFHIDIITVNFNYILSDLEFYSLRIGNYYNGLYRPAAFFLEPAHFSSFVSIGLLSIILNNEDKNRIIKAVLISVGLILTTSGLGIGLFVMLWGVYFLNMGKASNGSNVFIKRYLIIILFVLVIFLLLQFSFFSVSIQRIFGTVGGYNAVLGRLFWWNTYFNSLNGGNLLFGLGINALPNAYFTGFMQLLYAKGIIGCILFYWSVLIGLKFPNDFSRYTSIILVLLSFSTAAISFSSLVFYLPLIYLGSDLNKRNN